MNDYRDNIEIDLKDLLIKIIAKWKLLVLVAFIGVVAGVAYSLATFMPEVIPPIGVEHSDPKVSLTEKKRVEVERAAEVYFLYKKAYDETKNYLDNSVLMSVDASKLPVAEKTYLISEYSEDIEGMSNTLAGLASQSDTAANIVNLYSTDVAGTEINEEIAKELALSDPLYAAELYSIKLAGKSILKVDAFGSSIGDAEKVLDILSDSIDNSVSKVQQAIPHKIQEVSSYCGYIYDNNTITKKSSTIGTLNSYSNSMLAVPSVFTTDQKSYYQALISGNGVTEDAASVVESPAEVVPSTEARAKNTIKYGALGAFAGLFIVAFFIALKYILTPVLKTEDDLRTAFRLPIIGNISSSSDTSTALIYSGIAACAQKTEAKKIYLVSSSDDEIIISNINKMSSMFEGKDISVIAGGSILTDPSAIDEIVTSDGVILFEKIGKSLYEDIAREVELCNNYGVSIIGTVVVK